MVAISNGLDGLMISMLIYVEKAEQEILEE
jgi:hypothetical protein